MTLTTKIYKLAYKLSLISSFLLTTITAVLISSLSSFESENIIHMISLSLFSIALFLTLHLFFMRKYRRRRRILQTPFPVEWHSILNSEVSYYNTLNEEEKERFRREIQIFLGEKRITGIDTEIDDRSRVLVAASAIIPVFNYPEWEYDTLGEILVYPTNFDDEYGFSSKNGNLLGLVTHYGGTMIISKPALYYGFENSRDSTNVGIHEFAHKIDGADGSIDGTPALLMDKKTAAEWLRIVEEETNRIIRGKSGINPYAGTNSAEFFAVVSEYFFENPSSLAEKHPKLYHILSRIFKQDTRTKFRSAARSMIKAKGKKLGRNDPCPCGSGKKYKKCCLNKRR